MKDVRDRRDDDDREDHTNGDERKGRQNIRRELNDMLTTTKVDIGSPVPAHDELDTAE